MDKICSILPIIYKTVNKINGKIYVGKDKYNNSSYLGSGLKFKNALKKYGREYFEKIILEECDYEILNDRERFWIKKLNATDDRIGYNISIGGDGGDHYWSSLSEIEKIQLSKKIADSNRIAMKRLFTDDRKKALLAGGRKFWNELKNNSDLLEEFILNREEQRNNYYVCIDIINKKVYHVKNLKNFCQKENIDYGAMATFASYKKNPIHNQWACFKGQFNNLSDGEILQISLLEVNDYRKIMDENQQRSWQRNKTGHNNPNAKEYIFISPLGDEVIFNGNFEKECKKYTGYSVEMMRKLVNGMRNEYKGWKFLKHNK